MNTLFLRRQTKWFIILLIAANVMAATFVWAAYSQRMNRWETQRATVGNAVLQLLKLQYSHSQDTLETLAPKIQATGGDIAATREIINNYVTRAGQDLRIAWSDEHRKLRVGTRISLFTPESPAKNDAPVDLSHRDYIHAAMEKPGEIYVSKIHPHLVTSRPFYAISLGIADDKGNYLGCLASIIDVEDLQELFATLIPEEVPIALRITLPQGDTLYETGYLENGVKPFSLHESGFLLRTAFLRQAVFDLRMHYFLHYLIAAAATNGLILLGIWLIYRFYISPLQKLAKTFLSLPDSMLPTAPANDDEVAALVGRAKDIKNLLIDYHSSKEEARHYLETLKEAISMIHKLHEEQVTFLSTMSSEMEETFTAIHRYAGFVEGEIEEEYHHDDGLFLENLKDSAQNLKFLSNVFYLMCVHKSNEYSPEVRTLDLHHLLEQVVLLFSEVADYRHIAIDFPGQNAVCLIKSDETVLKHLLWGMLFIAMKFADDGARIRLETQEQDGMVLCRFHVSAILPEILPLIDEDLATFFPQSMTHGNLAKEAMENHINYKVLEYLLDHFSRQASLHISANENGHGFTLAATLFPMDA